MKLIIYVLMILVVGIFLAPMTFIEKRQNMIMTLIMTHVIIIDISMIPFMDIFIKF